MSTKLIFSFDSEDCETPAADNAEKRWAGGMTRHGCTARTCVKGEPARALRARGRHDVIRAMARHEIACHSNMHSAHRTYGTLNGTTSRICRAPLRTRTSRSRPTAIPAADGIPPSSASRNASSNA